MTLLKDIAIALNLSKATVSWILSGQGESRGFSKDTIELVQSYAKEINYQPNLVAKNLAKGTSRTIGLIVPSIADTFFAQIAKSIECEAVKRGYMLTYCSSDGDKTREHTIIKSLLSQQVDGLIIVPAQFVDNGIRDMIKRETPLVLIDRNYAEFDTNYIIVNNQETSYKLVTHLINGGCKKIAIVNIQTHLLVAKTRFNGYRIALEDAGIGLDSRLMGNVSLATYAANISLALDQIFNAKPEVDGFFFTTHFLALESLRYFTKRGIDYRNRFKMVCFHEMDGLDIINPDMTFARMPVCEIGRQAVNILINNIIDRSADKVRLVLNTKIDYK